MTVAAFNRVAKQVATKHGVPVIDLHARTIELVKQLGDKAVYTDGVHFTEATKKKQATFIAKRIREILAESKESR